MYDVTQSTQNDFLDGSLMHRYKCVYDKLINLIVNTFSSIYLMQRRFIIKKLT